MRRWRRRLLMRVCAILMCVVRLDAATARAIDAERAAATVALRTFFFFFFFFFFANSSTKRRRSTG
jgi:hypothetical protein